MILYHHTCPDCGLDVVTDHATDSVPEIKACACPSVPVETLEGEE